MTGNLESRYCVCDSDPHPKLGAHREHDAQQGHVREETTNLRTGAGPSLIDITSSSGEASIALLLTTLCEMGCSQACTRPLHCSPNARWTNAVSSGPGESRSEVGRLTTSCCLLLSTPAAESATAVDLDLAFFSFFRAAAFEVDAVTAQEEAPAVASLDDLDEGAGPPPAVPPTTLGAANFFPALDPAVEGGGALCALLLAASPRPSRDWDPSSGGDLIDTFASLPRTCPFLAPEAAREDAAGADSTIVATNLGGRLPLLQTPPLQCSPFSNLGPNQVYAFRCPNQVYAFRCPAHHPLFDIFRSSLHVDCRRVL